MSFFKGFINIRAVNFFLIGFLYVASCFSVFAPPLQAASKPKQASGVRMLSLKDLDIGTVAIHPDGTVIKFPGKPEIHVGKKGAFEIAYVENDLVVSGSIPGSKTNLFIYLGGRRYTLKLIYSGSGGDQIVKVRDPLDLEINPEAFHE